MPAKPTLILNVDDHDGARYVKTRILQSAGFEVAEAINGTDALALVSSLMPALVLLDVKLPDINGIEVCRRIKASAPTAGVLVLQTSAALTGRDDKIRGLEGGADNYLAAPIEADELIANVNALLRLRATQADLRDSEERFRQLTENIADVFWMFELHGGGPLHVSAAYDAMWGQPHGVLQAQPAAWLEAVHPAQRAAIGAAWQASLGGQPYEQEYQLLLADGTTRWVRDRAFVVRDAQDRPYRLARISSDISTRKQMESLLHEADQNKNAFLATLAHELRNPLSPIRNAVTLMQSAQPGDSAMHDKARQVITRQVDHLSRLVDDLLDVARISEGKLVLKPVELELRAVLAPALETVAPVMELRQHRLEVQLPAEQIWLSGDPVRLAQAIGNLLHNAAKFTPQRGQVRLSTTLNEDGTRVRIAVHDNGIGITDYNLPRIFGMFAQGAFAPDRAHDGLGIGLSLVSTLIQLHGGQVTADSPGIDQGSTFTIELPVLRVEAGAPAAAAPARAPVARSSQRRLLLVDDNLDSVEIMAELMRALGCEVEVANDSAQALRLAKQHRPDAIVLDIGLPDMDGYTLARLLRQQPELAGVRLVAHTGYGSPQDRQRSADAGFDFHLVKPANIVELQSAIGTS